jgi:hypothetical protein
MRRSGSTRPSDANRTSVRWTPGKLSRQHDHVIASDTEGDWQPEEGYDWVDPAKPKDKAVRWVPGIASNRYPNVITAAIEGQWRPADGYAWVVNPPRVGDMRVKLVASQIDPSPKGIPENPFQRGLSDRTELEQWIAALSGEFRRGADWWAARRSVPNPGSCGGLPGLSQDFVAGCEAAKARLTPLDLKRKSDLDYRRGWNSPTGPITPLATPDTKIEAAPVTPTVTNPPSDSDNDAAARLNAQELQRLRSR